MRTKRRQKPTKNNGKTHFRQIPTFQAYTEVYTGLHHTQSDGKDKKTCVFNGLLADVDLCRVCRDVYLAKFGGAKGLDFYFFEFSFF